MRDLESAFPSFPEPHSLGEGIKVFRTTKMSTMAADTDFVRTVLGEEGQFELSLENASNL